MQSLLRPTGPPPPPPGFAQLASGYTSATAELFNEFPPPPLGLFPRHGVAPIAQTSGSRSPVHVALPPLPAAQARVPRLCQLLFNVSAAPALDSDDPGQAQSVPAARPDLVSTLSGPFWTAKETQEKPKVKEIAFSAIA
ncbi:hypothetical protein BGW80DRAFT_1563754 [Lactifluus volemus]|nr:hypothetical protein BGW80DRAFT_1563754 [Lactifluus volemus]